MISSELRDIIISLTGASGLGQQQAIQPLWNDYGMLYRLHLHDGNQSSVVIKHIKIPAHQSHPQGLTSSISKQRKLRSYDVEVRWYKSYNNQVSTHCLTPRCLEVVEMGDERALILEDLSTLGFTECIPSASFKEFKVILSWLARFHAQFLNHSSEGLWESGTYWHLATRPEELAKIKGTQLHTFASSIDARLNNAQFKTLVHGDAKPANFCFNQQGTEVAAVDFQYVGSGVGIKDVAYLLGSNRTVDPNLHDDLLDWYFHELGMALPPHIDPPSLENEWRYLYPIACADFHRFLRGWSPQHWKLTSDHQCQAEKGLKTVSDDLLKVAKSAALAAGQYIQEHHNTAYTVSSKGMSSSASDILTEVDLQAQKIIVNHLKSTRLTYGFGLLAEEGVADQSRLTCHAFWAIDPLDGTHYFANDNSGYAVSIALVSQSGHTLLAVVYDPVNDQLFESVMGESKNESSPLLLTKKTTAKRSQITWFADQSVQDHPHYHLLSTHFNMIFSGGAVMNTINLLNHSRSCYCKLPKKTEGGGAIWDLAAASLILTNRGGSALSYQGSSLIFNRMASIFFNDLGLAFTSADLSYEELMTNIQFALTSDPKSEAR